VACSDGLSNQVTIETIERVLRDARSAERAARRLVNLALAEGALDNVTVAVVRIA
jgi:protein phosphatase